MQLAFCQTSFLGSNECDALQIDHAVLPTIARGHDPESAEESLSTVAELIPLTAVARRQPVHEIAFHLLDLVGADFGEALVERLCPEASRRKALIVPVLLEPLCERDGAVAVQGVDGWG